LPIDPRHLIALRARAERVSYTPRDAILYALGIGFGHGPDHLRQLPLVFEGAGLRVAPTFASAIARSPFLTGCGWDESRLVSASERLTLHRPLPPAATLLLDSEVTAVHDLGKEQGALVITQSIARGAADEQPLFTVQRGILARGDGGFGATLGTLPPVHPIPARPADLRCELEIRPEQALVYRFSGDLNPIHVDPQAARRAGLPGPVLQNLCTFGVACRGVLETICELDPTLITGFEARYAGDVYPGDGLLLELWQDANILSFRASVPTRTRTVLDNGRCTLAA
jgi:acyl dehydratase